MNGVVRVIAGICVAMSWALLILTIQPSSAQGIATGSIQGTITDTTEAVVPGAVVVVTNISTNVSETVTTRGDGAYTVSNLPVTTYSVKVTKQGFSTVVRNNVEVTVGQAAVINIQMTLGQETQTVTIQAQTVAITQDKPDRSVLLSADTLQQLPLQISSGPRLDDSFITLAPGVTGNTFSARINGAPDFSQDFFYDGIPYMNADGGGRQEGGGPPVDAVDEYAIDTNAYTAASGRSSGFLNFHIHSGTNTLHGGAWEYLRNNVLDSRGYFSPTAGTEKQNEFGFKVGGPIYIPKIYDGRNKTFFFFLWDWYKFRGGVSTSLVTLPTSQMLQGNFSQLPFPIYDPASTVADGQGGLTRTAFPGNIIPQSRLSVTTSAYLPLIPTATLPGIVNNAVAVAPASPINNKYPLVKIDHTISSKLTLHGSYYQITQVNPTSPVIPGQLGSGNNFVVNDWEPRLALDQTFSSSLLNQTAFSVQYTDGTRIFFPLVPASFKSPTATPGLPYPAISIQTMPTFGSGANNNQTSGGCWPCVFFADNLKWQKGRHSLSFGAELRWEDELDAFSQNIGTYAFSNGTTSLPDSPNFGALGYGFASFYLGTLNTYSRTGVANNRLVRTGYRAFYAQDDFKVTPRLTINAGLRWDYSIPVSDPHNQFSSFNPSASNPGAGGLPGSLIYAGTEGGACINDGGASLCSNKFANTYYNNWQPRLGFAYSVNPRTVFRGGFGIATIRGGASTLMGPDVAANYLTGFQYQDTLTSLDNGISPPPGLQPTWDVGIPAVGTPPPRTRSLANNQNVDYMQPIDGRSGYIQNWSLTLERQLPGRIAWETSYVGSSSVHIGANLLNENQVPSHYLSLGSLLYADINSPQAAAAGINPPYAGFTGTVAQALRPFPQFLQINERTQIPGHSNYHSLQLRLQKEYSNGLNFLVSYTWAKTITDGIDQFSAFAATPLDTAQRRRERQVLGADANGGSGPQNLSIAGFYQLPIGPGKPHLNHGIVGNLAGGWGVAGVLQYADGAPLPITNPIGTGQEAFAQSGTPNPIFNGQSRPNLVPGTAIKLWNGGKFNPFTQYYVNSAAFSDAGAFALGNAPPTLPSAPSFPTYNENISAIKRFKIWESANFEFRADFFNAFNRVIFGVPDMNYSDVATGGFGKVSSQANSPRVIQFGGRIDF
jgi:Carboxypeptidase regulatory-like domain/TonB dependent receptor